MGVIAGQVPEMSGHMNQLRYLNPDRSASFRIILYSGIDIPKGLQPDRIVLLSSHPYQVLKSFQVTKISLINKPYHIIPFEQSITPYPQEG